MICQTVTLSDQIVSSARQYSMLNISETVQDRDRVAVEMIIGAYALLSGVNPNDRE